MKNGEKEYVALVRQAQLGNEESRNRLAEIVRGRLRMYVYRLTLDNDWTEDVLQESMLEMFKFLDKLKSPDRLWGWLLRIATNNVRDDYNSRQRSRTASIESGVVGPRDRQEGLENLVSDEVKRVVSAAMLALKPRHRMVLALRCYEEMPFSKISEVMGCGQFGARMLFGRAKKALAKQLSRRGLTRGSLLMALTLFGKMTATTKAAAANVSVTAATLKAGVAASLVVTATSKTAVVTIAAAGLITAGSMSIGPSVVESDSGLTKSDAGGFPAVQGQPAQMTGAAESWYFYPAGSTGPVMMRLVEAEEHREDSRFRVLQNQHGNYRYDGGSICIENFRSYNSDLSVRRLPTDDRTLSAFISQVEGKPGNMEYVSAGAPGLLVICKQQSTLNDRVWRVDRHINVLDEVFFQVNQPEGTGIIDRRDEMHKRGWTYFRVSGRINGDEIVGGGRIPFVYEMSKTHYPWIEIKVGDRLRIIDSPRQAQVCNGDGKVIGSYLGGSFFDCLGNPWMGLHTSDAIRRAAAKRKVAFETRRDGHNKVEITLKGQKADLLYEIDLDRDLVESIKVYQAGGPESEVRMTLAFEYLEQLPAGDADLVAPSLNSPTALVRETLSVTWPGELANGNW
jgi:RNA polymerase sigma-70 factor (ECF subfamily)